MNPDWLQTDNFKRNLQDGTVYRQRFKICWGLTGLYMKWRWIEWDSKLPIPENANITTVGDK